MSDPLMSKSSRSLEKSRQRIVRHLEFLTQMLDLEALRKKVAEAESRIRARARVRRDLRLRA
jgi:hypothetical protein